MKTKTNELLLLVFIILLAISSCFLFINIAKNTNSLKDMPESKLSNETIPNNFTQQQLLNMTIVDQYNYTGVIRN